MLPVRIGSYLQPVLRYKCLILYTYHHPYTQYLREQGCEDQWLFVEAKKESASKILWKSLAWVVMMFVPSPLHILGSKQVMLMF